MAASNFSEQVKPFLEQLEKSLSSADRNWGDFSQLLKESAEIFRGLVCFSELFPSLNIYDDTYSLLVKADRIFDSNLQVVGDIFQLHANSSSKKNLLSKCNKMSGLLPQMKTLANLPEVLEFSLDKDFDTLTSFICCITGIMDSIHEILVCFRAVSFVCNPTFSAQEFVPASTDFKEGVTMLESKFLKARGGDSRFLVVFFNTFQKPFEIAMKALSLLFIFPTIEDVKFAIILKLCENAVRIFTCAVDMLHDFTKLFLQFDQLRKSKEELLQKFRLVSVYCNQIFEFLPSDVPSSEELDGHKSSVSEETPTASANLTVVTDTNCNNIDTSKESQSSFTIKQESIEEDTIEDFSKEFEPTLADSAKDTHCIGIDVPEKLCEVPALDSTVGVTDINCNDINISKELQHSLPVKLENHVMDVSSFNSDVPKRSETICAAQFAKESLCSEVKSDSLKDNLESIDELQGVPAVIPVVKVENVNVSEDVKETCAVKPADQVKDKFCKIFNELQTMFEEKSASQGKHCDATDLLKQPEEPASYAESKHHKSGDITKSSQETSVVKSMNRVSKHRKSDISKSSQDTSAVKSKSHVEGKHCKKGNILKECQETPILKPTNHVKGKHGKNGVVSKESHKTAEKSASCDKSKHHKSYDFSQGAAVKSVVSVKDKHCKKIHTPKNSLVVTDAHCNILKKPQKSCESKSTISKIKSSGNSSASKDETPLTNSVTSLKNCGTNSKVDISKETTCGSKSLGKDILKKSHKTTPLKPKENENYSSSNILKITPKIYSLKPTTIIQDNSCTKSSFSKEAHRTLLLKPSGITNDTNKMSADILGKMPKIPKLTPTVKLTDKSRSNVGITNTPKTSTLKSTVNSRNTNVNFSETKRMSSQKSVMNGTGITNTPKTTSLKSAANSKNINASISETKKTFLQKPVMNRTDITNTPKTTSLKSAANSRNAIVSFSETKKVSSPKSAMNETYAYCVSFDVAKETQNTVVLNSEQVSDKTQKDPRPKPAINLTDKIYASVGILRKIPNASALKSKDSAKGDDSTSVNFSKETQKSHMNVDISDKTRDPRLKPAEIHASVGVLKKIPKISVPKSNISVKKGDCAHVNFPEETKNTAVLSSVVKKEHSNSSNVSNSKSINTCASSLFLNLWDIKVDAMLPHQKNTLDKVIQSYKTHAKQLLFSVKMTESETRILCKICGRILPAENIEKHLKNECQLPNAAKQSNDNNQKPGAVRSTVWFDDINKIELDSLSPKHRNILREVIEKINRHSNHFSFSVKFVRSEYHLVWCKLCRVAFVPNIVEEHITDPMHQSKVFKQCKTSLETQNAVTEISAENWKFLELTPDNLYRCSLCNHVLGPSISSWIHHFKSDWHSIKLKESEHRECQTQGLFTNTSNPGKVQIKRERRHTIWGAESIRTKASPYGRLNLTDKPIFSRLFSSGEAQIKAEDRSTANSWGNRSVCSKVTPYTKSNLAGQMSEFFRPGIVKTEADEWSTTIWHANTLKKRSSAREENYKCFGEGKSHIKTDEHKVTDSWHARSIRGARATPYTKPKFSRSFVVSVWKKSDSPAQTVTQGTTSNPVKSSQGTAQTLQSTSQDLSQNTSQTSEQSTSLEVAQNGVDFSAIKAENRQEIEATSGESPRPVDNDQPSKFFKMWY